MKMKINMLAQTINAKSPVTIEIRDNGNSYVRATFSLDGKQAVTLNEPETGSVQKVYEEVLPGNHHASFVVTATKSFGPTYHTKLFINNQQVASAEGTLATFTEADFANFILNIA